MGFGFIIFAFTFLLLLMVCLLVLYTKNKRTIYLKIIGIVITVTLICGVVSLLIQQYQKPIKLTKNEIVGTYRIDKNFYPGQNSDWQYERFYFIITQTDSLHFYVVDKNKTIRTYSGKVTYRVGPPDLWTIQLAEEPHHIIEHPPTLYRGHDKFYYVFCSDFYKNMFFRKVEK